MTYDRVNWENEPSENTPISAENLNKMDSAIKQLSEMVVANPVEADTDELKKIEIEGTVYKIAGGHELVNASGSTMTQRSKMSFPDSHLTDDSGNNQTIVDIVKEVTTAQWNNATEEGLYYINDKPDSIITAEQVAYDDDNSVKDKIDTVNSKIQKKEFLNTSSLTFNNIPQTCRGFLHLRGYSGNSQTNWTLTPFIVEAGSPAFDTPLNIGSSNRIPSSVSYSNGTLTFSLSSSMNNFAILIFTD